MFEKRILQRFHQYLYILHNLLPLLINYFHNPLQMQDQVHFSHLQIGLQKHNDVNVRNELLPHTNLDPQKIGIFHLSTRTLYQPEHLSIFDVDSIVMSFL